MPSISANSHAMKTRLFVLLFALLAFDAFAAAPADKAEPNPTVTTTKRSAIKVGNSSFALVKGTKLEMLGREGKDLIVKYRTSQGKIPYADTDYVLSEEERAEEEAAAEEAAAQAPAKPATPPAPAAPARTVAAPVAKPAPAPAAVSAAKTPPPALAVDGKPTSNYGKMVQKAKQAEQAHQDKLVKPSDEILEEKPRK